MINDDELKLLKATKASAGAVLDALNEIDPDFVKLTIDDFFERIYSREGLDLRTREFIMLATLISQGDALPQLRVHLETALNVGITEDEIKEVILQLAFYVGVPRATNALLLAREVFKARK